MTTKPCANPTDPTLMTLLLIALHFDQLDVLAGYRILHIQTERCHGAPRATRCDFAEAEICFGVEIMNFDGLPKLGYAHASHFLVCGQRAEV